MHKDEASFSPTSYETVSGEGRRLLAPLDDLEWPVVVPRDAGAVDGQAQQPLLHQKWYARAAAGS